MSLKLVAENVLLKPSLGPATNFLWDSGKGQLIIWREGWREGGREGDGLTDSWHPLLLMSTESKVPLLSNPALLPVHRKKSMIKEESIFAATLSWSL